MKFFKVIAFIFLFVVASYIAFLSGLSPGAEGLDGFIVLFGFFGFFFAIVSAIVYSIFLKKPTS